MRKIVLLLTLLGVVLSACARPSNVDTKAPIKSALLPMYQVEKLTEPVYDPVEAMLKTMTLEEKVGQLVIAGFYGTEIDAVTEKIVTKAKVGGIIFFKRNIATSGQIVKLLNNFKSLPTKVPLFLSVDEEGGSVNRLPDELVSLPNARSFAKRDVLDITYDLGFAIGYALNQYGFNLNYAPIMDVVTNTATSAIGTRSFSADPAVVSEMGMLMARGMESAHVISVIKHFPGLGNTTVDTHDGIPVLKTTLKQLSQLELVPYAYAIQRDVSGIMVGHIAIAAYDRKLPASLSYQIMTGLLRNEMGFKGVIFTDDLGMGAISIKYTQAQAAVLAILAGADVVLVSHGRLESFSVVAALKQAVLDGRISEERVDESVRRILKLKFASGLDNTPHPNANIVAINAKFTDLLH
jgi:beta-N-acetylhexosaminidase